MSIRDSQIVVEVPLNYRVGRDEPERGIFRNSVVPPGFTHELTIAVTDPVREHPQLQDDPDVDLRRQVHLVGTARALEELGRYLIGLARLTTLDPEPYGMLEDVRDGEGSTIRLLPRRVSTLPQFVQP